MLKLYYLSSEIKPFSDTGQLASFSKEFSSILKENKDVDIRLIQPKYGFISDRRYILREVIRLKDLKIDFMNKEHTINIKSGFILDVEFKFTLWNIAIISVILVSYYINHGMVDYTQTIKKDLLFLLKLQSKH